MAKTIILLQEFVLMRTITLAVIHRFAELCFQCLFRGAWFSELLFRAWFSEPFSELFRVFQLVSADFSEFYSISESFSHFQSFSEFFRTFRRFSELFRESREIISLEIILLRVFSPKRADRVKMYFPRNLLRQL